MGMASARLWMALAGFCAAAGPALAQAQADRPPLKAAPAAKPAPRPSPKTVETLTTDAGCAPTELQALGRWLYWNCGDKAGVYDRTAKKSVPVPADEAKLGDGYVVTHDKASRQVSAIPSS